MKLFLFFLLITIMHFQLISQEICSPGDIKIFNSIINFSKQTHLSDSSIDRIILETGKQFLGTPYVGGVLDEPENENLVINLTGLDCVTFLESTLALAIIIKSDKAGFSDFCRELKYIRYRNGIMNGYGSRLHYFYDWIRDNEQKGILENITKEIGGISFDKKIEAMSAQRDKNPHLKNDSAFRAIRKAEEELTLMDKYFIPKEEIKKAESKIHDGDLVAFATTLQGMEVAHVGIAIHLNNELHLMHASSLDKKVEISDITLSEFAFKKASYLGIIVARIQRPQL
ncbi:MAG TPA: N-acetylmuramoyl-L-alanine amidase-like domain-containing protein [Bacteroidales bacterium]|nr:N-acetylmuramoyl-L-alanine amidase-like domain-containing protein [Bacteroidales bacterium]